MLSCSNNNNRGPAVMIGGFVDVEHGDSLSKFRGFKIEAKNVRRNIMLKLKNARKNIKSQLSLSPIPSGPSSLPSQSEPEPIQSRLLQSSNPNLRTLQHKQGILQHQYQHQYQQNSLIGEQEFQHARHQSLGDRFGRGFVVEAFERRMGEYLGVVFRKVQTDTDKIIKNIAGDKGPIPHETNKTKLSQTPNINFLKRLKFNTMKLRLKKQRNNCKSIMENKHTFSIDQAQNVLEKIHKTEEFKSPRKNKNKWTDKQKQKQKDKEKEKDKEKNKYLSQKKIIQNFNKTLYPFPTKPLKSVTTIKKRQISK